MTDVSTTPLRTVVADDSVLLRDGLVRLLTDSGFDVVAAVGDADGLLDAVTEHQPPMVHGRRIKLRYAHQGGKNPPIIVIHGNQTAQVPAAYQRYLMNRFRAVLGLRGTPLRIEFKSGENPYAGRRNKLTERQLRKRGRMMKHVRKKK